MEDVVISRLDSLDATVKDVPYEQEAMEPQVNLTPAKSSGYIVSL